MFLKDFRKEFYDVIQHQRVLVLVAFDVDALCACKILQTLFRCDQILYTIIPVSGKEELERAYIENSEGMQHVLLINCGGNVDIVELLQPEPAVRFYICDSFFSSMGKRKSRKPGHYCRANAEASPGRFGGLLIGKGDGKDKMFPIDAPLCLIGRLMISLIGKKGRDVAAILTPEMKRALDILVTSRATVGIDALNRYLFPRSTGDGHIEGHVCLSKLAYDADLKYPERIGSTKLRKYIATVVQMLNLEHGELEWLSNHLGHTIDVHKEFYRNQEGAVQLGKVAKMLIAVDQGRILDNQTDENADGDVSNQNPDEQWLVLDDSSSDDEDDDVSGEASAKKSSESNAPLDGLDRENRQEHHRPVDVHNVYNAVQVKLLMKSAELPVPAYDDVFRDEDSDDDSGNDSDSSERSGKRKRFDDAAIVKRMEKRKWEENRTKVLFDYMQFSTYGTCCALLMFELAWKMSKDSNELLWLAITGVTDQLLHYKIPRDKYIDDVMALQSHVSRLNHRGEEEVASINCLKVQYEDELQLSLYRHWSLFDSLCHSISMACRFKVWTLKGQKRLHEFLAEMGLPLTQCKQKFSSMDPSLKTNIRTMIQENMNKYGLVDEDVILPSFFAQYGFKHKLCATDVALVAAAMLETNEKGLSPTDCFLKSQDVLSRCNTEAMEKGIEVARRQLEAIIRQVQTFLDMHQVISAGPFLYALMQEGAPDVKMFAHPQCIMRLARFTLEAHCSVSRNKKARNLPLVLGVPLDNDQGTMLVIGIPPLSMDDERKNFFGKAFEQAASSTNCRTLQDSFDTFLMEMKNEDRSKFFDALISLLN